MPSHEATEGDDGAPITPAEAAQSGARAASELTPSAESPDIQRLRAALSERYVIERELGRGGMATVYLARDLRHDRPVAVKVLERNLAPGGAARFLHEIRTAARLTHPHILSVHDSGDAGDAGDRNGGGLLYYVMPYVEGETLRARLTRGGALPLRDALRLLRELADALVFAHGRGVVHRDLKPENVLIAGGHAVVADFGIAKAIAVATQAGEPTTAGLTGTGVALGTPAYMAPEQAVGDTATDHRADLYALGVVAYEVLAGAHPFGARTSQALVAAHLTETAAPLAERRVDTPPAVAALVMQLLAKDPAARPQSAEAVLLVLDDISASPATKVPGVRRVLLAAIAVLLVVAAVGGYALWRVTPGSPNGRLATAGGTSGPVAIRALAVLPFVNTGGTATDDYFSDGMTDELAHALTRVPGLQLAGRTSSYAFKGKAVAAQEIGRALDVGAIVTGTVRRAGDRLRVTTQLVSTADGKVLWDSVYESRSTDVFGVQDEFTRATVAALAPALGDRRIDSRAVDIGRGTTSQQAYDLYLKGRYYWLARGTENVARSIGYFQQAVAIDSTFARAHAGLALAYDVLSVYDPDPSDSVTALVTASARRAVALDSTLADGPLAMAIAIARALRIREAETRFRAALRLEPSNAPAHHAFGALLLAVGRTDDAVTELRQATHLDPLAKSAGTLLALALVYARQFPEAEAESRRVMALDSAFALVFQTLGLAQVFAGHPDSAISTLERGTRFHPEQPLQRRALLFAYAVAGRWADAEQIRAQIRRSGSDLDAAFAELVFGDREPLVRLLTTEAGQRRWHVDNIGFGCDPLLDPLWADARFRAAMRRLTIEPCPLARPWPLPPRPGE